MNYKIEIHTSNGLSSERLCELTQWFYEEFGNIPIEWSEPEYYVLALSDTQLIGRIGIIERMVFVNGYPLKVAGISGVITHSDCRKSGIATDMLQNAVTFFNNDLDIKFGILLCRDEVASFYEKLGWKITKGSTTFDQPNGKTLYPKLTMVFESGYQQWPKGEIDLNGFPW